jgi:prevent-host-death family protein
MTRVELRDATGSLSEYTRKARKAPVVVTRRGRPVALLRVVSDEEWEDFVVSSSPAFRRIIERSWKDYEARGGVSLEQIERQFALPPRPGKAAKRSRRSK